MRAPLATKGGGCIFLLIPSWGNLSLLMLCPTCAVHAQPCAPDSGPRQVLQGLAQLLPTASNAGKHRHALLPQEVEEIGSPQGTAGSPSAAQQLMSHGHRMLLHYTLHGGGHCSVDCDCCAVTGAPGRSAAVSPRACAEVRWAHQFWTACQLRKAYLGPGHQGEAVHMRSMGT